jgi:outer membrane protein OmpA-like peptidoglycan-associated protein
MRRFLVLCGLVLLAGCGTSGNQGTSAANVTADTPAAETSRPVRQIGQISSLSGDSSALTGQVTDFSVTVTETATVIALAADTLFAFDKADLQPAAVENLRKTADLIRQGGEGAITITGHTDAKGDDAYNQALSLRRADAVAAWLKGEGGFSNRRFETVGKGKSAPVAPNAAPDGSDDPAGRTRNRRVEVSIPKKP